MGTSTGRAPEARREDMHAQIAGLGRQLRSGFELGVSAEALPSFEGARAVVVCGMGGSGIAGDVVRSAYGSRLSVPLVSSKGYALPAFCDSDTIVVAVSFSGNTEETLAAYAEAVARGCRVAAISAGGELAALAEADGVPRVEVPGDVVAPRAALGYLGGASIGALAAAGAMAAAEVEADIERAARLLDDLASRTGPESPAASNVARRVSEEIAARVPIVWGSEGVAEAPALRWRTQICENAKRPAFGSVLPELDHNDVEGWAPGTGKRFGVVVLRHAGEHPRIGARVAATSEAIASAGLSFSEVWAEGETDLERVLSLVMVGDFASVYLAEAAGVDPVPIPVLTSLKERLRR